MWLRNSVHLEHNKILFYKTNVLNQKILGNYFESSSIDRGPCYGMISTSKEVPENCSNLKIVKNLAEKLLAEN